MTEDALNSFELRRLDEAMSCPFDAVAGGFPRSTQQLVYGCWVALLATNLPDPELVTLLVDRDGVSHRTLWEEVEIDEANPEGEREPVNFMLGTVDHYEYERLLVALEGSRRDMSVRRRDPGAIRLNNRFGEDDEAGQLHFPQKPVPVCGVWLDENFGKLTGWIQELRLVLPARRKKHWVPPWVSTKADLQQHSASKSDEGFMAIDVDQAYLRESCLAAIAADFVQAFSARPKRIEERRESEFLCWAKDYLVCWNEVFDMQAYRLGLDHRHEMGFAAGQPACKVVYDISPTGKEFHTFPVAAFPSVRRAVDERSLDL
jgi:hypothetical protein